MHPTLPEYLPLGQGMYVNPLSPRIPQCSGAALASKTIYLIIQPDKLSKCAFLKMPYDISLRQN